MKIAVTGASGYLGRNFLKMYKDQYELVALTRNAAATSRIDDIEYRESDYSRESLKGILSDCDAIIHLAYAMATKDNEEKGPQAYRSSASATKNVLNAARMLGIRNIVFASSRLVYPNYSSEPFREDEPAEPGTYYGKSKVMMELLCEEFNHKGACIKILRFGQIIGAEMKVKGLFSVFMERAGNNEPLLLIGSDVRDYVYVKDACRAIMAALQHPGASGIYNISMGTGTDNRAMAETIIKVTGSSSDIMVKEAAADKEPDKIVLDCSKAERELGFSCEYDTIYKIAVDVLQ